MAGAHPCAWPRPGDDGCQRGSSGMSKLKRRVVLGIYFAFLVIPIYWLVVMSLKTNEEIVGELTLVPHHPTLANYLTIVTDASWYVGYINSLKYVLMNTVLSLIVAL